MKTNAALLPLLDHDQYVAFSLVEIGHHSSILEPGMSLTPGLLAGCEFFTVRWIERGSELVRYLIFHMSGNYALINEQLDLVKILAHPDSITVTTAHRPPDDIERPLIVATALGISVTRVQHVHTGDPLVRLGSLT